MHLPAGPGPFPLVVAAHGFDGHPSTFTELFGRWADAGYVVAAPAFPLSNDEVPGEPTVADLASQPGDVSFVIDELLAAGTDGASPVFGAVDPERIGVAGLSLGAATTTAFWDLYLWGDEAAEARLVDAVTPPSLATLEYEAG